MSRRTPDLVDLAVRVYPDHTDNEKHLDFDRPYDRPGATLVFDTETRTDAAQRLTFGSFRFIVGCACRQEGLFYADDLPDADRRTLEQYVANPHNKAKAVDERLHLLTRSEFVKLFYRAVYKGRCLLVGFNLPFDLSRIAYDFLDARGRFAGGFSLGIWTYSDELGSEKRNKYRPRIRIKHIDSKRALKGFTGRDDPEKADLIPDGSATGKPEDGFRFRGHFLDLRTLAFALTDKSYSLESACEDFDVEHPKHPTARHGEVTEDYIDYNRRDVLATAELAVKLLEEYDKHKLVLQETKAFSPASIGKAYLRKMGINPILERQPDFPKTYLGYAQSAFFGGRTSAHIRKIPVPVVYTDFRSMYPTVNSLMDLWSFVTARRIHVIDHCQAEVEKLLNEVLANPNVLFRKGTWKRLTTFVKVVPDGDILPSRAEYNPDTHDWQVGLNHLYADPNNALWYSLPDAVASALLTGRLPNIVDAFRIEAQGKLPTLDTVKLRSVIEVDPREKDFFRVVIEQRVSLSTRTELSDLERKRLDRALKVLANATSYGIYAEMNRQEGESKVKVQCYGIDPEPYTCKVLHPEAPGEYCFPPLASLITGAARLMLAVFEHCVHDAGGTYAMEDTDSMAVVATEQGGKITCRGHEFNALSWKQVDEITAKFARLNPYDRGAVPGSILKLETDNRDPITHGRRQVYCLAISAKRYALFVVDEHGNPILLRASCPHCGRKNKTDARQCSNEKCKRPISVNNEEDRWSEHGLGHLLNPTDPETDDREWIGQTWENIIRRATGLSTQQLSFAKSPAVGRVTVSNPALMRPFTQFNKGKKYGDQIKPFNFLVSSHVHPFGQPIGTGPERFHLIAPWQPDAREWPKMQWIDQYSGKQYNITTIGHHGTRTTARVKTYSDVLLEYEFHAESKCADANGETCSKQTVGLLRRRHIHVNQVEYIGKESNNLEEVESGLIRVEENVYTRYPDTRREWQTKVLPALRGIPLIRLIKKCEGKLSRRALIDIRAGRSRPHKKNQAMLEEIVRKLQLL